MGHKKSGRRAIQPQTQPMPTVAPLEQIDATPDSSAASAIAPTADNALLTGRINPLNIRKVKMQRAQPLISHRRNGRSR